VALCHPFVFCDKGDRPEPLTEEDQMTLSKTEKAKRAATRARNLANAAAKTANDAGLSPPANDAGYVPPRASDPSSISSPAIRSAREIPETGTVTVACKMPNGLLLRIFSESVEHENVLGGGTRQVKVHRPVGDQVRIQGYAVPINKRPRYLITNGNFALTEGVDAKFFKTWWEQNADCAMIKAGLIFCMKSKVEAEAKADSREDIRNGLEPMALKDDPRSGKTLNPNLEDIKPADRKAAAQTV
jgi:hypothetical protein